MSPEDASANSNTNREGTTPSIGFGLAKRAVAAVKSVFLAGKHYAMLETRVTALEAQFERHPPDVCERCGERAMRVVRNGGIMGDSHGHWRQDDWKCERCGYEEPRIVRF